MASMILLCLVLIQASTVLALVIGLPGQTQQQGSGDSALSIPADGVLEHGNNASVSMFNVSAQTLFDCDEGWGRDLNLQMCGEAIASIPRTFKIGSTPVTFGPREANTFDVGLPRRWMSSNGICGIQPFLLPGKESARVATRNTYVATAALVQRCVGGKPSKGGQARNFVNDSDSGGDNNLLVTVSDFDAYLWSDNVRCFGSIGGPGIINSCNGLADRMDASESPKNFGPPGVPHDYLTPYTLRQGNRCYLRISSQPSNRYRRTASWYQIWEGAILVNAMCIRNGMKGTFKVFSDDMETSWLEVEMGDLQTPNNLTLSLTDV